ncbi:MAG: carboxypeptidase regulatory-like domain-containing protein [Planctomycetota bacterium]|nr:carboxypeptidase regulatory-like domain-containing protein [Planctomycetota bacterium]
MRHLVRVMALVIVAAMIPACGGGSGGGRRGGATPPAAPTGLTVTAGDVQVSLSWNASAGADTYNIYYATVTGVTKANYTTLPGGTQVAGITTLSTIFQGLTNGTTYFFIVTAVNANGESAESAEASGTPFSSGGTGGGAHAGAITVTVLNEFSLAPLAGATVTLEQAGAHAGNSPQFTDAAGQATLTGVPAGVYKVTAVVAGFTTFTIDGTDAAEVTLPILDNLSASVTAHDLAPTGLTAADVAPSPGNNNGFSFTRNLDDKTFVVSDTGAGPFIEEDPRGSGITPGYSLINGQPVAAILFTMDMAAGTAIKMGHIHYPTGVPAGDIVIPLQTDAYDRQVEGDVTVPGGGLVFDLQAGDTLSLIACSHLGNQGDLGVGLNTQDPTATSATTATFDIATGNQLNVFQIDEDESYAYIARVRNDATGTDDKESIELLRGSFASLTSPVAFSNMKEPVRTVATSGTVNPTLGWSGPDTPGLGGGLYRVTVIDDAGTLVWKILARGDFLATTLSPLADSLATATIFDIKLEGVFVARFDFNSFSLGAVEATHVQRASHTIVHVAP